MNSAQLYEAMAERSGTPAPNMNMATGVRYGVISSNHSALDMDAVQDIQDNGTDLTYASAVQDIKGSIAATFERYRDAETSDDKRAILTNLCEWFDLSDLDFIAEYDEDDLEHWSKLNSPQVFADSFFEEISDQWNDGYCSDASSYLYEQDGYKLQLGSSGDIFVLESPYYSMRGLCSPCAPNACHLDTDGALKCYALGEDWFKQDATIPYSIYRMRDGVDVTPAKPIKCDECRATMINGVFCHETGCPNARRQWDAEREQWITYIKCGECGSEVEQGETCDCQTSTEYDADGLEDC